MTPIRWKDSYSVNHPEIDAQHQEWISIFNKLHSTLLYGHPFHADSTCRQVLNEMVNYTQYHFRHEEDYLRSICYPEIVGHCRLHKNFINLICRHNQNEQVLIEKSLEVIKKWLLNHILVEDIKYSDFVKGAVPGKGESSQPSI